MKSGRTNWKKDAKYAWLSFRQMETFIEKDFHTIEEGKGVYVRDDRNVWLLDGSSLLVNSSFGHSNKHIKEAIYEQMNKLDNMSTYLAANNTTIKCSKKICKLTDNHFFSVFFTNSGSEATDTAIKIIKKYYRNKGVDKKKIVSLKNAYHGSSLGAMALTQDSFEGEEDLFPEGFLQITAPDLSDGVSEKSVKQGVRECIEEVEKIVKTNHDIAAIYIELVQLSNGVCVLPKDYVEKLYEICKKNEILFVVDEVATGFGRTGEMFASQHYGLWPDIMTVGKGISGGCFPIAGVAVTEEIFNTFYELGNEGIKLEHGYTASGNPVGCAAILATIDELEKDGGKIIESCKIMGKYLLERLEYKRINSNARELIDNIRGKGLMVSVNFKKIRVIFNTKKNQGIARMIYRMLRHRGVLIYPDSDYNIIIAPPLIIEKEQIDLICEQLFDTLDELFLLNNSQSITLIDESNILKNGTEEGCDLN